MLEEEYVNACVDFPVVGVQADNNEDNKNDIRDYFQEGDQGYSGTTELGRKHKRMYCPVPIGARNEKYY